MNDFFPATQAATDKLPLIIRGLLDCVLAWTMAGRIAHWMQQAISRRVSEGGNGIAVLLAAFRAGTLRTRRSPAPGSARVTVAPVEGVVRAQRLSGGFGWLVKLLGYHAAGYGSQLRHLLEDPELIALLAVSPRARRMLRSMCWMLGVEMPGTPVPAPVPPSPRKARSRPRRMRRMSDYSGVLVPGGAVGAGGSSQNRDSARPVSACPIRYD